MNNGEKEEAALLENVLLPLQSDAGTEDQWMWLLDKSALYKVNSSYKTLLLRCTDKSMADEKNWCRRISCGQQHRRDFWFMQFCWTVCERMLLFNSVAYLTLIRDHAACFVSGLMKIHNICSSSATSPGRFGDMYVTGSMSR